MPGIADAFVMADRACSTTASRVFFEKGATHAERHEDALLGKLGQGLPADPFHDEPEQEKVAAAILYFDPGGKGSDFCPAIRLKRSASV